MHLKCDRQQAQGWGGWMKQLRHNHAGTDFGMFSFFLTEPSFLSLCNLHDALATAVACFRSYVSGPRFQLISYRLSFLDSVYSDLD